MTATPIPRTLAITIFGDLDISSIKELPGNRQPITTKIVSPSNRRTAYKFIKQEIKKGRQAFVICPKIETSTETNSTDKRAKIWENIKAVKEEYEKLSKKIFPKMKIEMLHGKLKPKEKETIMKKFSEGKIDIIVSTSVVEVGVDIPNATIMMIEGADRFGLAQLYQFQGRVGRGKHKSYCLLFSDSNSTNTKKRLKSIVEAKNSFELAEKDLEIRGPGEFIGKNQAGMPDTAMEALQNISLIKKTKKLAEETIKKDPELKKSPELKKRITSLESKIHEE
jgi:ATP-dependent DNA helicase RecG